MLLRITCLTITDVIITAELVAVMVVLVGVTQRQEHTDESSEAEN